WQKLNGLLYDWEKQYEVERLEEGLDLGDRFIRILKAAHEKTGRRAVVLVDEYDKPVLDVLDVNKDLEEEHRNILKGFYSVFKGADEHLQFVLLTGVTKFSQ
ncbi:AAA family ATPase, partial [Bacteroides caecigallinarum]|uniref:AAA family ATPase n=2 Tax=Bacteroides caecigallinarum TaxID=1411144 RepID=UPI00195B06BF